MTLLLMAAGSGSRYGKLKQFDELGPANEFLMEFSIYDAIKYGFNHIVIITKEANKEVLENYLSQRLPKHIKLDVLVQNIDDLPKGVTINTNRVKPWGTAQAVWTARDVITSDFVIINADDYYGQKAFEGAANFIKNKAGQNAYALIGYDLKNTLSKYGSVSRGVCEVKHDRLTSIIERTKIIETDSTIIDEESNTVIANDAIASMNFWICNPSVFKYIEDYFKHFLNDPKNLEKNEIYLPFVAQEMMANGLIEITVIDSKSLWFGVTYYADKDDAVKTLTKLTKENKYPCPLWR